MANDVPGPDSGDAARSLVLRDVVESDLPIFFSQQMDLEATRMAAFPSRDKSSFMAHWHRILADSAVTTKTIVSGSDVVGNIGSWEQDGEREVGYWLGREYWGKGLATRALSALLREVTVRPLYAHAARDNVASIRVLEKCGFVISGYSRFFAVARGEEIEEAILELHG